MTSLDCRSHPRSDLSDNTADLSVSYEEPTRGSTGRRTRLVRQPRARRVPPYELAPRDGPDVVLKVEESPDPPPKRRKTRDPLGDRERSELALLQSELIPNDYSAPRLPPDQLKTPFLTSITDTAFQSGAPPQRATLSFRPLRDLTARALCLHREGINVIRSSPSNLSSRVRKLQFMEAEPNSSGKPRTLSRSSRLAAGATNQPAVLPAPSVPVAPPHRKARGKKAFLEKVEGIRHSMTRQSRPGLLAAFPSMSENPQKHLNTPVGSREEDILSQTAESPCPPPKRRRRRTFTFGPRREHQPAPENLHAAESQQVQHIPKAGYCKSDNLDAVECSGPLDSVFLVPDQHTRFSTTIGTGIKKIDQPRTCQGSFEGAEIEENLAANRQLSPAERSPGCGGSSIPKSLSPGGPSPPNGQNRSFRQLSPTPSPTFHSQQTVEITQDEDLDGVPIGTQISHLSFLQQVELQQRTPSDYEEGLAMPDVDIPFDLDDLQSHTLPLTEHEWSPLDLADNDQHNSTAASSVFARYVGGVTLAE